MQNPFRPGNGVEPPYLAGREDYLREFSRALENFEEGLPRNFLVFGPRGTGKTVLLNHFAFISKEKGWFCVPREFNFRYCDENVFADAVVTDIVNKASEVSLIKKVKKTGESLVDALKPEEISVKGISYKPFYKEKKGLLEDDLKTLLLDNWKIFQKSNIKGVVLLYDEFHTVIDNKITGNYPLASFLTAVSYAQREGCRYFVTLSGLPNLPANLKAAKTYVERMFSFRETGNLSEGDARKAILLPLKDSGYEFNNALITQIIKETSSYPYFIQFYCYYLIENAGKAIIKVSDLAKMRKHLLQELDISFFKDRFERATPAEQEVLIAMASIQSDKVAPVQMTKKLRVKMKKSNFFICLNNLIEKNLIYKNARGSYSFSIPLFRDFLMRKAGMYGMV